MNRDQGLRTFRGGFRVIDSTDDAFLVLTALPSGPEMMSVHEKGCVDSEGCAISIAIHMHGNQTPVGQIHLTAEQRDELLDTVLASAGAIEVTDPPRGTHGAADTDWPNQAPTTWIPDGVDMPAKVGLAGCADAGRNCGGVVFYTRDLDHPDGWRGTHLNAESVRALHASLGVVIDRWERTE